MRRHLLCLLLVICQNIFAQKQNNVWCFGSYCQIDFNSGSPQVNVTAMFQFEGSASISDANGTLLFYTDGITIWNRNHGEMSNGFELNGHFSSTMSAIIVPMPGSTTLYYIFTTDAEDNLVNNHGLQYSIVDMTLEGGMGNITVKNQALISKNVAEKVTAIAHCNGKDVWVITRDVGTNALHAFLVTSSGVNFIPVTSNVGTEIWPTYTVGYMNATPDGKTLVCANSSNSPEIIELYDFDNNTGFFSNPKQIPISGGAYGVEFSPDGTKLYASTANAIPSVLWQYDLLAGGEQDIINSAESVFSDSSNLLAALQLAPDGKIYIAKFMEKYLGTINNPNAKGLVCDYVNDAVFLQGNTCQLGLPAFMKSYFFNPSFSIQDSCSNGATLFTLQAPAYDSVLWNFGDAASNENISTLANPVHEFTAEGTFHLKCIVYSECRIDTITKNISNVCKKDTSVKIIETLYIPDSFTPNSDNINDVFYLYGEQVKTITFEIHNRWGELIYQGNDILQGWNGWCQNELSKEDIYVCKINCQWNSGKKETIIKRINLIR